MMPADVPPATHLVPVTVECVRQASKYAGVHPFILLGILRQEAGRVGRSHANKNGTFDHGPMQINDVWADEILKFGITKEMLRDNGCVNVHVGAWILRKKISEHGYGWQAVGAYHSKTPDRQRRYMRNVAAKVMGIVVAAAKAAKKGVGGAH